MATYHPAEFPYRPKHSSIATEIAYRAKVIYYQYEINTSQYCMSPGEKVAFNLVLLSLLVLMYYMMEYVLRPYIYFTTFSHLSSYIKNSHDLSPREGSQSTIPLIDWIPGMAYTSTPLAVSSFDPNGSCTGNGNHRLQNLMPVLMITRAQVLRLYDLSTYKLLDMVSPSGMTDGTQTH